MVAPGPRAWKWILAALVVSLGLNLFIAGTVVGHKLHRHPHEWSQRNKPDGDRKVFGFIDRMAMALPREDRAVFMGKIDGYRAELKAADQKFRDARKKVQDAIAAEPFDRNALDTAFGEVSQRMADLQKVLHAALSDAVSALPPDARKRLAHWDKRPPRRDMDRPGARHGAGRKRWISS